MWIIVNNLWYTLLLHNWLSALWSSCSCCLAISQWTFIQWIGCETCCHPYDGIRKDIWSKFLPSTPPTFCCAWRPQHSTDEDSLLLSTQLCSCWAVNVECTTSTTPQPWTLPCHFVASCRLNYTLEHIILISTFVSVFIVRVGEHNFYVIIITFIRLLPCCRRDPLNTVTHTSLHGGMSWPRLWLLWVCHSFFFCTLLFVCF